MTELDLIVNHSIQLTITDASYIYEKTPCMNLFMIVLEFIQTGFFHISAIWMRHCNQNFYQVPGTSIPRCITTQNNVGSLLYKGGAYSLLARVSYYD